MKSNSPIDWHGVGVYAMMIFVLGLAFIGLCLPVLKSLAIIKWLIN